MQHQNHPNIVRRLRRAEGHLQTIIAMIEKGRPCLELAQQLQAIENAIDNAKKAPIIASGFPFVLPIGKARRRSESSVRSPNICE